MGIKRFIRAFRAGQAKTFSERLKGCNAKLVKEVSYNITFCGREIDVLKKYKLPPDFDLTNEAKEIILRHTAGSGVEIGLINTLNKELKGGDPPYARQPITWNPPLMGGVQAGNTPISFNIPAGNTVKGIRLYDKNGEIVTEDLVVPVYFVAGGIYHIVSLSFYAGRAPENRFEPDDSDYWEKNFDL